LYDNHLGKILGRKTRTALDGDQLTQQKIRRDHDNSGNKAGGTMNEEGVLVVGLLFTLALLLLIFAVTPTRAHRTKTPRDVPTQSEPGSVTIPVGVTPTGMAITPSGRFLYVANNNNYNLPNGDSVTVIDLQQQCAVATIHDSSFKEPYTITIHGCRMYVTNSSSTTVTVVDTNTHQVVGVIGGFDGPSGMAVTENGRTGFVNNYGSSAGAGSGNASTVSVVCLSSNENRGIIRTGLAPAAVALSPCGGSYLYVICYQDGKPGTGTMSVVRTADNVVVRTVTGFSGPFDLVVSRDLVAVTNFGSNDFSPIGTTVSIVDRSSHQIVRTVQVGLQPSGIALSADGGRLYVANFNTLYASPDFKNLTPGQGTVSVVELCESPHSPGCIVVGQSPHAVLVTPDGRFVCASNFTANTVTVCPIGRFN
jgi:YVTN family beta-propeller protein